MGVLIVIGCFVLLSLLANNPDLFWVLIPVVGLLTLVNSKAKKTKLKQKLERDQILRAQAAERAELDRLNAIESKRLWDIEIEKQQQVRMQRVNRKRENFGIVSEHCGVCGSELNTNGLCVSGCKPLEE